MSGEMLFENTESKMEKGEDITVEGELVTKSWVSNGDIFIERKSHLSERKLSYHESLCTGCGMCTEVCPRTCIELNLPPSFDNQPLITINPEECLLCGICSEVCLFNAIELQAKGKSLRQFAVILDWSRCQACGVCAEVCPSNAIQFPKLEIGTEVERIKLVEEICIFCGACERICPVEAISVIRKKVRFSVEGKNPWTKRHRDAFMQILSGENGVSGR